MGFLVTLALGVGLMFLSRLLYKPPKNAKGLNEDQPTTLTSRGSFIPLVLGTRRIGYVFGWAGDRTASGSSSSGKGGGGDVGGETWKESGWHILCVGPGIRLHAIYQDNKKIWDGPIDPVSTPSGTTFSISGDGSFTVYWGFPDQPVDSFLADISRVGIASRWPNIFYIVWQNKKLGGAPNWPLMEYVVTVGCSNNILPGTDYWIRGLEGINPANAIHQLLTAPFPHGLDIPLAQVDQTSQIEVADACSTEGLAANLLITDGPEAARPLQALLSDVGVVMPLVDGRLYFKAIRDGDDAAVLTEDVISPPDSEVEVDHGDERASRLVFSFKNKENDAYRDTDIKIDNDGESDDVTVSSQSIVMETVTDLYTANLVARRRSQELAVKSTIKLLCTRAVKQLVSGQLVDHPTLGQLRIVNIKRDDETAQVEIECTPDVYGVPDVDHDQADTSPGSSVLPVAQDIAFTWFELPPSQFDTPGIVVLRMRAHEQITGALVWVSGDGTNYSYSKNQNTPAAGGILEGSISASTDDIIVAGPAFEAENDDVVNVLDLSASPASLYAGRQIATINNEVFFLESITVVAESAWVAATTYSLGDFVAPAGDSTGLRYKCTTAGTSHASTEPTWPTEVGDTVSDGTVVWTAHRFSYEMNNMIRARYGSTAAAHSIGDRVFIAEAALLTVQNHPVMRPGDLYVKTQPFTAAEFADIAGCTPVQKDFVGDDTANYRVTVEGGVVQSLRQTRTGDVRITNIL